MTSSAGLGWWLDQIGRIPLLTPAQEIELGTTVQTWLNHPGYPDRCPPGIRRRGQRAKERFVNANLRLAVSYISKNCNRLAKDHSIDDLVQAANIGLISAVERFDPARGYRFSTYAYWWIRQAVNRWVDKHGRSIAIPGSHSQRLAKLGPITRRLELELCRPPTHQEIAKELRCSVGVLEQLLINARSVGSLDATFTDDGATLADCIPSDAPSFDEQQEQQEQDARREQLLQLITTLPKVHQRVLRSAYGFDGEVVSLRPLAKLEGLSVRELQAIIQSAQDQLKAAVVQLTLLSVTLVVVKRQQAPIAYRRSRHHNPDQMELPLSLPSLPAPSQGARRKRGRPKVVPQLTQAAPRAA